MNIMSDALVGRRIYVAGHRGLAGSALVRRLGARGLAEVITRAHAELDLTDRVAVRQFLQGTRPEFVIVAAARVGGIVANRDYPADFIRENIAIETNVIEEAYRAGVDRLVLLGSSCIYPRDCAQPMKESYLLTGPLEWTNRPYAIAKIAGIEMCWAYNRQYGARFLAVMPTNLYGPNDNYDLESSHVLPALIRKIHEAKAKNAPAVTVWGTGKVLREFLHADDMADAVLDLLALPDTTFSALTSSTTEPPLVNIGSGEDLTIQALAEVISEVIGYTGSLVFDHSKPDGTPRKLLDIGYLRALGWRPRISLHEGIAATYRAYLESGAGTTDGGGARG